MEAFENRDKLVEGTTYLLTFRPNSRNKSAVYGPYKVRFLGFGRTPELGNADEWQRFAQIFEGKHDGAEFALNNAQVKEIVPEVDSGTSN